MSNYLILGLTFDAALYISSGFVMEIAKALVLLGQHGRFQIVLYFMLWVCNSTVSMNHLIMAFYGYAPPHRCATPPNNLLNSSLPIGKITPYHTCLAYEGFNISSGKKILCPDGWKFTLNGKETSIVSEWSLVCDDKHLAGISTTVYFAGVMVGGVIFGALSDRFGRKPILLSTLYAHIVIGVCIAVVPTFVGFVTLRFFLGLLMQGLQSCSYIMMLEFSPWKHRTILAGCFEVFWAIGTIWMAALAWMIQDWRHIQLALCLPSLITIIYIWYIPESIRWLLTQNRPKDAISVAHKIAKFNRVTLPDDFQLDLGSALLASKDQRYTPLDLFKTSRLRKISFVMFYIWMATSVGYYGLSLNSTKLAGNKYLNFFIGSLIDLAAFVSIIWILKWFGRRKPLMIFFLIGGITCIISGVIPKKTGSGKDLRMVSTAFAQIGKFFVAACFATIFLFTSELFPTVIRNVGFGACAFWARAGGMIAPQILLLGQYTFKELPVLIFGGLALIAAGLTLLLPETRDAKLSDTIVETECENKEAIIMQEEATALDEKSATT